MTVLNDLNNSDIVQAGTKLKTITAILVLCSNVEQNPRVGKHTKKEELAKLTEAFLTEFPGKDNFSAMALLFLNENRNVIQEMSNNCYKFVEENYSQKVINEKWSSIYSNL